MKKPIAIFLVAFSLIFQNNIKAIHEGSSITTSSISYSPENETNLLNQATAFIKNVTENPNLLHKIQLLGKGMLMPWSNIEKFLNHLGLFCKALKNGEYNLCTKELITTLSISFFSFLTIKSLLTNGIYVPDTFSINSVVWTTLCYTGYIKNLLNNIHIIKNITYPTYNIEEKEINPKPAFSVRN